MFVVLKFHGGAIREKKKLWKDFLGVGSGGSHGKRLRDTALSLFR